ncbi:hypothetical protein roselon_01247 [Roseibacterium elongatum DSM 19469]|uniref:Uncharacterized protein n=1 Tax=Roseicyclus elongatus DSM 19469 TaxID=1294273 RepID=W8S0G9_9RHOB|nr:hypothetical protein roselon_01247 [Roseibacterium elongatum DSM 19469]
MNIAQVLFLIAGRVAAALVELRRNLPLPPANAKFLSCMKDTRRPS